MKFIVKTYVCEYWPPDVEGQTAPEVALEQIKNFCKDEYWYAQNGNLIVETIDENNHSQFFKSDCVVNDQKIIYIAKPSIVN